MRQKHRIELNLGTGAKGEALSAAAREPEARAAKASLERPAVAEPSMEAVVERENLKKALAQVKRNKGAPGVDGMSVDALASHLKEHWLTIRAQLLEGTYKPQPLRRVEIPKASGGLRPPWCPGAGGQVLRCPGANVQVLGGLPGAPARAAGQGGLIPGEGEPDTHARPPRLLEEPRRSGPCAPDAWVTTRDPDAHHPHAA